MYDPIHRLTPRPRQVLPLEGQGGPGETAVEVIGQVMSYRGRKLLEDAKPSLPGYMLPPEGYVLEVLPAGVQVVARDAAGAIRARQTLAQLAAAGSPRVRIADWPASGWRGLHALDSGPASLPKLKRLIAEVLGPHKCNVLVYEPDYNFAFASHPEIKHPDPWTKATVRELVDACAAQGIKIIPQINCLGHQSWRHPAGALLQAHPELEEPPDARTPQADFDSKEFYCRSWCPSHPDVPRIAGDLIGELLDAFGAEAFHAGMDETFVIASQKCPRCSKLTPAQAYAKAVNDLHAVVRGKHGKTMYMWSDRLLDAQTTGYGVWEASGDGTHPAADLIPKDIIQCDWHYENGRQGEFPSLEILTGKGFTVIPTVWKNLEPSLNFLAKARAMKSPRIPGGLTCTWHPLGRMADALWGEADEGAKQIAATVIADLDAMWQA